MDSFDLKILETLQSDGAITNSALADIVNLSPSQCSRRRAALENNGVIEGYKAQLNANMLGYSVQAIVRINLISHDKSADVELTKWFEQQPEIQEAYSVSGDADYTLLVWSKDLSTFSEFIHDRLLFQPQIAQVRSEFILRTFKKNGRLKLSA